MKKNAKNKFLIKEKENVKQLEKLKPNEFWSRIKNAIDL